MKVGDVVTLKSGGPAMTVEAVKADGVLPEGFVRVTWMESDPNGMPAMKCRQMPRELLVLVDQRKPSLTDEVQQVVSAAALALGGDTVPMSTVAVLAAGVLLAERLAGAIVGAADRLIAARAADVEKLCNAQLAAAEIVARAN